MVRDHRPFRVIRLDPKDFPVCADLGTRMRSFSLRRLGLFLLLGPVLARGADGWTQLRLKMTPDETVAAIGEPLFRTAGRGFELWIYDNRAEALLFSGSLVGWTSPAASPAAGAGSDIWRDVPDGVEVPTFLSLLPAPKVRRMRVDRETGNAAYVWLPGFRFRD